MGINGSLWSDTRAAARRAEVRLSRWPAVCERPHPPRHGAQQDPEGHRHQVALDGRLRRALPAGVRLPWPADRIAGRPRARAEEARDVDGRDPAGVPRVCGPVHRCDDRRVQAADGVRRLGPLLPDDEPAVPGRHRAGAGQVRRARAGLQGQEAGALVHPLPHRAGRGGSRVRRSLVAVDLRRVSTRPGERGRSWCANPGTRRTYGLRSDLDDDAMDDTVQSGDRVPPRFRLRRL